MMTTCECTHPHTHTQEDSITVDEIRVVNDIQVTITYASRPEIPVSDDEIRAYIKRGNSQNRSTSITALELEIDGEEVGVTYHFEAAPFDRIRRITGYLVGTLDRFNDAKRAEERNRVKHSIA